MLPAQILGGVITVDFELSEEQILIRETFANYCDRKIKPEAAGIDEAKQIPHEMFMELAEMGFFGMRYPEAAGGSGLDFVSEFRAAFSHRSRNMSQFR